MTAFGVQRVLREHQFDLLAQRHRDGCCVKEHHRGVLAEIEHDITPDGAVSLDADGAVGDAGFIDIVECNGRAVRPECGHSGGLGFTAHVARAIGGEIDLEGAEIERIWALIVEAGIEALAAAGEPQCGRSCR